MGGPDTSEAENETAVVGLGGLIGPSSALERVATGAEWSEGPLWIPATGRLRVRGRDLYIAATSSIFRIATLTRDAWAGRAR